MNLNLNRFVILIQVKGIPTLVLAIIHNNQ